MTTALEQDLYDEPDASAEPEQVAAALQDHVLTVRALLTASNDASPRAMQLAQQISDLVDQTAALVVELQAVVQHDQILAELSSLDTQMQALAIREKELRYQLTRLPLTDAPAPLASPPKPTLQFRAPATGEPDPAYEPELWETAVRHYTYDGRVRGWLQKQELEIPVKSRGPLKREHVELYLRAHPELVDQLRTP